MKHYLILAAVLFVAFSCAPAEKINSTGKPYEIMVVTPKDVYNSAVGDTLKSIFNQEVLWLNQPEPIYDMYNIPPASFNNLAERHRNLLVIDINPATAKTRMVAEYDKYAKGQIVFLLNSPSIDSAALYLSHQRVSIVDMLDKTEKDRFVGRVAKYGATDIETIISEKFGLHIGIPKGFRVRVNGDNFLWLSNELPLASQGIVIYNLADLPDNADSTWFVAQREASVNKIPGPSDGSFMSTDTMFYPETFGIKINDRQWIETRGFWNVKGDFMGGPFANFITGYGDNKYIGIDLYVQSPSPKYGKRNYMRQLESIPWTIKFDKK